MSTALERDAMQIVRDMVRVASSPAADLGEDGADERLFAARIERLCEAEIVRRLARQRIEGLSALLTTVA